MPSIWINRQSMDSYGQMLVVIGFAKKIYMDRFCFELSSYAAISSLAPLKFFLRECVTGTGFV
jgi:hypothetical protein